MKVLFMLPVGIILGVILAVFMAAITFFETVRIFVGVK